MSFEVLSATLRVSHANFGSNESKHTRHLPISCEIPISTSCSGLLREGATVFEEKHYEKIRVYSHWKRHYFKNGNKTTWCHLYLS